MRYSEIIESEGMTPEQKRAEIIQNFKTLPYHWKNADGSTSMKNPRFYPWLERQHDSQLDDILDHYRKVADYIRANPKAKIKSIFDGPAFTRKQKATLVDILKRALPRLVEHLKSSYDADELARIKANKNDLLDELQTFLTDKYSIDVREDGLVTFWHLDPDTERFIGDLPIALYHFTSSRVARLIKADGLASGRESINRTVEPGVYLTTETSGPAVQGYVRNAVAHHGGQPVCVIVKAYLSELEADPDDHDISSGRHQFRVDHVPPDRIVKIERV
jgi:hypothetical protein